MIKESPPTITIKQEPDTFQEEQEDLILSYLNSDYVSMEPTPAPPTTTDIETVNDPPSPPYSTCSADATTSVDMDVPSSSSLYIPDPLLFHFQSVQGLPVPWPASTAALPTTPFTGAMGPQDPSCLMNIHPLYIPSSTNQPVLLPHTQPQLQPQQSQPHQSLSPRSSSCSSVTSSSSDSEQSKKKRGGRKKREVSIAQAPLKPLTRILPAAAVAAAGSAPTSDTGTTTTTTSTDNSMMTATSPYSSPDKPLETTGQNLVKTELSTPPSMDRFPSPPSQQQQQQRSSISSHNNTLTPSPEKTPAEIAYAKRQERLIKNRAAALLSRKRKREHLTTLEEERQQLATENQSLHQKVSNLEARVTSLEQENMELKQKLSTPSGFTSHKHHQHHHNSSHSMATPKHTKATGMVFMIILFSFAFFTLPSSHSSDQLTVGGGGSAKPNIPMIGSSSSRVPVIKLETIETSDTTASPETPNTTTDLMLIDRVRPGDLQSWIKEKLVQQKQPPPPPQQQQRQQYDQQETGLTHWYDGQSTSSHRHLYLYTDQFSRVAAQRQPQENEYGQEPLTSTTPVIEPTLSILCPLNTSSSCESPTYLQIDVQVVGSRILQGELRRQKSTPTTATAGVRSDNHHKSGFLDNDGDVLMFDSHNKPEDATAKRTTTDRRRQLRKLELDKKRKRFSRVVLD